MDTGRRPRAKRNGPANIVSERTHGLEGFIHHLLNAFPVGQQGLSGGRRLNASPGTFHQARLQKLLKLTYLHADSGLGNAHQIRRSGKTAALDH